MRLFDPTKDITSHKIEPLTTFSANNRMQRIHIKIGPPISFKIPDEIAIVVDEAVREWYAALGYPIPEEIGLDILLAAMEIVERRINRE